MPQRITDGEMTLWCQQSIIHCNSTIGLKCWYHNSANTITGHTASLSDILHLSPAYLRQNNVSLWSLPDCNALWWSQLKQLDQTCNNNTPPDMGLWAFAILTKVKLSNYMVLKQWQLQSLGAVGCTTKRASRCKRSSASATAGGIPRRDLLGKLV